MASFRQGCVLALTLALSAAAALAAEEPPGMLGLYDRPALVIDPGMHTAVIRRASADSEGRWAATGSDDKTVRVWSLADGALARTIRLPAGAGNVGKVYAVAMSSDGRLIAAGGSSRGVAGEERIYLFDRASASLGKRIDGLPDAVLSLSFSPDGERLAAMLGHGGLRIYARQADWMEAARDEAYAEPAYGGAFAPDGSLATTSFDGKIRLYTKDPHGSIQPTLVREASSRRPSWIAFSPDGARLAVGHNVEPSPDVDRLDARDLSSLARPDLEGILGALTTVAWSRDGATLYAAGASYANGQFPVLAWTDGGAGVRRTLLPNTHNRVASLVPLPLGDLLVASMDPSLVRLAPDGTPRWHHGPPSIDLRGAITVSGQTAFAAAWRSGISASRSPAP